MTLPRYGRERYKNSPNLDILPTYTQGMSKSCIIYGFIGMTLPRYGRERYKNSLNLDILSTYTQGMSKSCIIYTGLLV